MADKKKLSARQEAGVVSEDFEQLPNDEVIAANEHLDHEVLDLVDSPVITAPSTKGNPYMSEEEQGLEMEPKVMGPPQYGSPEPATSAGRLLPLNDHPLHADRLPEGHPAAISEDYGKSVRDYTHAATDTSHSINPPPTDLELDAAGLRQVREENYEELSKDALYDETQRRNLDGVNKSTTKAELVEALEADDASREQ